MRKLEQGEPRTLSGSCNLRSTFYFDRNYNGEYDNLLYYYFFFYNMIQHRYKATKRGFTTRHSQRDFIRDDEPLLLDAVRQIPIRDNGKVIVEGEQPDKRPRTQEDEDEKK